MEGHSSLVICSPLLKFSEVSQKLLVKVLISAWCCVFAMEMQAFKIREFANHKVALIVVFWGKYLSGYFWCWKGALRGPWGLVQYPKEELDSENVEIYWHTRKGNVWLNLKGAFYHCFEVKWFEMAWGMQDPKLETYHLDTDVVRLNIEILGRHIQTYTNPTCTSLIKFTHTLHFGKNMKTHPNKTWKNATLGTWRPQNTYHRGAYGV